MRFNVYKTDRMQPENNCLYDLIWICNITPSQTLSPYSFDDTPKFNLNEATRQLFLEEQLHTRLTFPNAIQMKSLLKLHFS